MVPDRSTISAGKVTKLPGRTLASRGMKRPPELRLEHGDLQLVALDDSDYRRAARSIAKGFVISIHLKEGEAGQVLLE